MFCPLNTPLCSQIRNTDLLPISAFRVGKPTSVRVRSLLLIAVIISLTMETKSMVVVLLKQVHKMRAKH